MKTAIVTGGNRGIGFEICRQLSSMGFRVILCSRNLESGLAANQKLNGNAIVKQLDITSEESVQQLYEYVKTQIGSLDILINNAGIGEYKQENPSVSGIKSIVRNNMNGIYEIAKRVNTILKKNEIISSENSASNVSMSHVNNIMETNLYGAWRMIQFFIPLLKRSSDARIINISSGMGELKSLTGYYPAYSLSKASLNAITIMFANELKQNNIKVNAMCPGWVKTNMGGPNAPKSVEDGADTAIWLATEKEIPTGKFFKDRKEMNW